MDEKNTKNKKHILIIDDSPEDVLIYRRLLARGEDFIYQVSDVASGEEGLAFLGREAVDCVLLDYKLPDLNGLEFLSELQQQKMADTFPVILLTGQGDEQVAVQAMKSGAANYLIKGSLTGDLLLRSITHAIDQMLNRRERERYHAFLETLIDTVPNPLFLKAKDGRYTGCNKAFESLTGRLKANIVGQTVHDLFPKELATTCQKMDTALLQGASIQAYDIKVPHSDGRVRDMICYQGDFREIDSAQEGLVGVLLDITTQKQTEAELRKTQKELEASILQLKEANRKIIEQQKSVVEEERLKVLLQMAGATAHELNQPLMILLGNIDLIRNKSEVTPKDLDLIDASGQRIAEIVQKIQLIRHDDLMSFPGSQPTIKLEHPITVLTIEDNEADYSQIQRIVEKIGNITLIHARNLKDAYNRVQTNSIDVILLDYMLPDGSGFEFMGLLKQKQIEIPVVMITGQGNEVIASESIQSGAYDYLPKSRLNAAALARVLTSTLEKSRFRNEIKNMTEKMAKMATRDELTGLYNRRYFNDCLQQETERASRYDRALALAIFDLDHFKKINDVYGHPAGDYALRKIGKILLQLIRKIDIACRYGGEEMTVIMPETNIKQSIMICERIRDHIQKLAFEWEGKQFSITISAGVAQYDPSSKGKTDEFVQTVDRLLYEAKASGRNRVVSV
jgi:two-component system cell cycle response regulator